MSAKPVQLAMGQMLVEGGQCDDNFQRAVRMVREAAARGCQVIVLPECLDAGWTHPSARQLAQPIPGKTSDLLCQTAADAGVHVVAGVTERDGTRIFNTAVLIADDGRILLKHRKINILDMAQDLYATGDQLSVAATSFGTVGVNICADNFPDSLALGHALARMGAQCLLSPCAWAVDTDFDHAATPYGDDLWKPAYTTLARLYEIPVVGVSNVGLLTAGPWAGRKCIGCSLAVSGDARVLAEGPFGESAECLLTVELTLTSRAVTGTQIAGTLRRKGYDGP